MRRRIPRTSATSVALIALFYSSAHLGAEELPDVVDRVKRSVVVIEAKDRNGNTLSRASGFAVAPGIVATNIHVLKGASKFVITRSDGKWATGRGLWHFDAKNDVALVQLSNTEPGEAGDIPSLKLAEKDSVRVGMPVYVIGHPEGLKFTVSAGILSALDRHSKEIDPDAPGVRLLQTDAATLPGSSGGPWVNKDGEVIGVHRAGLTLRGVLAQGFNFGCHVEHLEALLARERKKMLPIDHFAGGIIAAGQWTQLIPPNPKKPAFTLLASVALTGPGGDKNELAELKIDGAWKYTGADLRPDGRSAAVSFGVAKDFTFDAQIEFEREGGHFWLLGWNDGNGYVIREPGLRKSGHWRLMEVKDGKVVPDFSVTLSETRITGKQSVSIEVDDGFLTFKAGPAKTAKAVKLPHYREGEIVLGTYPAGYGPRPLRVLSARIRAD